jgi:DNA-binding response OmpR family regulator/putative methionine-R-sulfoxide reductase with GAF domain
MDNNRILIVDDSEDIRRMLRNLLEQEGCEVRDAASAEDGLALVKEFDPAVAIVDIVLPGMNGLEMLDQIKEHSKETEVLIITGHTTGERAFKAIRQGAYDYLEKPFVKIEDIWITTQRAIERRRLAKKNRALLEEQERRNQEVSSADSQDAARTAEGDSAPFSELLDYFIGLVAQRLDVERASLMLLDEQTGELQIAASRGLTGIDPKSVRVRLGEGIAGTVAKTGETLLVTHATTDPGSNDTSCPEISDSFVSAPMVLSLAIKSGDRVLGVINAANRRSGKPFSTDDVAHLMGLASQIAAAIEGTRRFDLLKIA